MGRALAQRFAGQYAQRHLSPAHMQRAAGDVYGGEARREPALIAAHTSRIIAPGFMGYIYQLIAGTGRTGRL